MPRSDKIILLLYNFVIIILTGISVPYQKESNYFKRVKTFGTIKWNFEFIYIDIFSTIVKAKNYQLMEHKNILCNYYNCLIKLGQKWMYINLKEMQWGTN